MLNHYIVFESPFQGSKGFNLMRQGLYCIIFGVETSHFINLSEVERKHWYFAARRQLIEDLIYRHISPPPKKPALKILDIGCGTGGTTEFLTRFGAVTALEPSEVALNLLKSAYPHLNAIKSGIEDMDAVLGDERFDLAVLLGVLCHKGVENPLNALKNISGKIKTGGWLIWHESAYPFLRHKNDELSHGARRFYPSQMRRLLRESALRIRFKTHLGFFALPLALMLALLYRTKGKTENKNCPVEETSLDRKVFPERLNTMFYHMIRMEMLFAQNIFPVPIGVSYFVMAQKI